MVGEPPEFDLFGEVSAATRAGQCAECGARFEVPANNGRPQRFCSDPCRRRHKLGQTRAWAIQPDTDEPTLCAGCGAALPAREVTGGRFRRFCSPTCRIRTRRHERDGAPADEGQQVPLWDGEL